MSDTAPDPTAAYVTSELGAQVFRMTFLFDIEAMAPAVAKFRSKTLLDSLFQMMDEDPGVRLAGAVAAGNAARAIRGVAYIGDTEAVTHPFDLRAFEKMRNQVIRAAVESGAIVEGTGNASDDAAALRELGLAQDAAGPENRSEGAQAGSPAIDPDTESPPQGDGEDNAYD